MANADQKPKISQKTAFLIFVIVMLLAGPFLYSLVSSTLFITSPEWIDRTFANSLMAAAIVGLAIIPILIRITRRIETRIQRWSVIVMGPVVIASLLIAFVFRSLPIMLVLFDQNPVSYAVTVDSTQRRGKVRCDFPFSIKELYQSFCASTAESHAALRPGKKIEIYGSGNNIGMFVEGYRIP